MASPAGFRVNTITLAFTVIAGLVVFFRLFTRFAVIRKVGLEDGLIVLSMCLSIGLAVTIGQQVRNGLGWHIEDLDESTLVSTLKAFWASIWMYNLSLTTTKVSILIQYLRIFPTRRFRIVCSVVLGFVTAYGVWTLFGSIFLCAPVHFFWDKSVEGGKCLNQFGVWFTNAGVNIFQDFVILLMPMPLLRRLEIPSGQKKALAVVFAAGGLVCIVSVVRIQSLVAISNSNDPTFDNPPAAALSAVEANVAIVVACLPFLRPLMALMMPTVFSASVQKSVTPRPFDEERPKHSRSQSLVTRPTTAASSKYSHRRVKSDTSATSELSMLRSPQPRVARTGSRYYGPVRQVTINSGRQSPIVAPLLPRVPENIALMSPIQLQENPNRFSLKLSSPVPGWHRPKTPKTPKTPRTPRTPRVQKPLPITPFPIHAN